MDGPTRRKGLEFYRRKKGPFERFRLRRAMRPRVEECRKMYGE